MGDDDMNFDTYKIKDELVINYAKARHCDLAELSALVRMSGAGGYFEEKNGTCILHFQTENFAVARKCFTLIEKTFNINTETFVSRNLSRETISYTVAIKKHEDSIKVLQATKLIDASGDIAEEFSMIKNLIILHSCCKRAFLRGAFLAAGSISNPEKSYHIEIVCAGGRKAEQIKNIINTETEAGAYHISFTCLMHPASFLRIKLSGEILWKNNSIKKNYPIWKLLNSVIRCICY